MKTIRTPAIVLGLLYLGFVAYLVFSASRLPDRLASRFNAQGQPGGWMSRSDYLWFMAMIGFAFPAFIVGLTSLFRLFPRGINLPHRDYWLAPKRRADTYAYLHRLGLWYACVCLCFVIGLNFLVVQANHVPNAHLSNNGIAGLVGGWIAGSTLLVLSMALHFSVVKDVDEDQTLVDNTSRS